MLLPEPFGSNGRLADLFAATTRVRDAGVMGDASGLKIDSFASIFSGPIGGGLIGGLVGAVVIPTIVLISTSIAKKRRTSKAAGVARREGLTVDQVLDRDHPLPTTEQKKQFKRFEWKTLGAGTLGFVPTWVSSVIAIVLVAWTVSKLLWRSIEPVDLTLSTPWFSIVAAFIISLWPASAASQLVQRILLPADELRAYEQYQRREGSMVLQVIWKWCVRAIALLGLVFLFLVTDYGIQVSPRGITHNGFLGVGPTMYDYDDFETIVLQETWPAPNGNPVERPRLLFVTKDGTRFDTQMWQDGRDFDAAAILELIQRRRGAVD